MISPVLPRPLVSAASVEVLNREASLPAVSVIKVLYRSDRL